MTRLDILRRVRSNHTSALCCLCYRNNDHTEVPYMSTPGVNTVYLCCDCLRLQQPAEYVPCTGSIVLCNDHAVMCFRIHAAYQVLTDCSRALCLVELPIPRKK